MRALLILVASSGLAHADGRVSATRVHDGEARITAKEIEAAVATAAVTAALDRCKGTDELFGWIAFQSGNVMVVDVGGSKDRASENCVAAALRKATLAGSKGRVVATIAIKPKPQQPTVTASVQPGTKILTGAEATGEVKFVGESGGLTSAEINNVIKSHARAFRACYSNELARTPKLAGKVVVEFKIGPEGAVPTAVIKQSLTREVDACILKIVHRLQFPAKGGTAKVVYPFVFSQA